jgi:hypothetical protein
VPRSIDVAAADSARSLLGSTDYQRSSSEQGLPRAYRQVIVLHHLLELPVEQVVAEADGNRTRLSRVAAHTGFEDRGAHQDPDASKQAF